MNTGSRPPARPRSPDAADAARGVAINSEAFSPTQTESLVPSCLVDAAAATSSFASSLTHAAINSIQSRMSKRGRRPSTDQIEFLREAIFVDIAQQLIERVERRLKAERQKSPCRQRDRAMRP
jgi:hypothetical protein